MLRRIRVAAGAAVVAAAFLSHPAMANAAEPVSPGGPVPGAPDPNAVRVWSVWQSDGTAWLAATPKDVPADGSVIGWRFAASPDSTASEPPGGELADFATLCAGQAAVSGSKRVAVQVDFGDATADAYPGDTPPGALMKCVTATPDSTTTQLLASAATTRADGQGTVLAVSGYPSKEKGGSELATTSTAEPEPTGLPLPLILGGAGALVLLAGGAVVATRRRKEPARH
ncbi:SCO2322 family protein [Nonomuraea sp. NBC_01738]|uniref:SCO2322 family protein n=1 Tax=Nonomuraea sp. NBC_01738 TaxID=2976003 RepID=UPI002E0FAE27|nr:SCO2322 family protein [Nonomuraea sp. NBC_01738]